MQPFCFLFQSYLYIVVFFWDGMWGLPQTVSSFANPTYSGAHPGLLVGRHGRVAEAESWSVSHKRTVLTTLQNLSNAHGISTDCLFMEIIPHSTCVLCNFIRTLCCETINLLITAAWGWHPMTTKDGHVSLAYIQAASYEQAKDFVDSNRQTETKTALPYVSWLCHGSWF